MKVWIVQVATDSGDHYLYAFKKKVSREEMIKRVWREEGKIESLKWYSETTSVSFDELEVEE